MRRTKMDEIVENMANYICDHICQKPKEIIDQEKMEDYCNGECEMGQHFYNILNQYNEINNFEESELYKYRSLQRARVQGIPPSNRSIILQAGNGDGRNIKRN